MANADPSQERLLALHEELLAGDVTAPSRMAELLLPALKRRFVGRGDLDWPDIESIIGESITKYVLGPERYDPSRSPLLAYLYRDVRGDILNAIEKRRRRREEELEQPEVEHQAARGNPTLEDEVLDRLDPLDLPPEQVEAVLAEVGQLSTEDREFLCLRASGVRSTHAYAAVLGITHLPVQRQRREVKRVKDRLDKRLRSIRGRVG